MKRQLLESILNLAMGAGVVLSALALIVFLISYALYGRKKTPNPLNIY